MIVDVDLYYSLKFIFFIYFATLVGAHIMNL